MTSLLEELGRPRVSPEVEVTARAIFQRHVGREDTASLVAVAEARIVGFIPSSSASG